MKKLSVLLVAAAVALGASAGVNFKSSHKMISNKVVNTEMTKMNPKALKQQATSFRVVTEQPEGEVKTYERAGRYDYVSSGYLYVGDQPAKNRVEIVYGDDNKVWLKNILCGANTYFGTDSWVEGTIEDGMYIVVPLGQSIAYNDYYDADIILTWGNVTIDADGYFALITDADVTEAVYEINGDTISLLGSDGPVEAVGDESDYMGYGLTAIWSDDDSWTGFMEWNTVLTESEPVVAPEVITEIPEGCQTYTYYRNSATIAYSWFYGWVAQATDGKFTVAFDNQGNAYIQNPLWWLDSYNTWVKGTYDWMNGYIIVPTGQFLSWYEQGEYGYQLLWGGSNVTEGVDEETGETGYYLDTYVDSRTEEIYFMVDGDNFYLLGTEGDINAEFPENFVTTGMVGKYNDEETLSCIEFCNRDEYGYAAPFGRMVNLVPAVPANPTADEWYDCGDESGFSKFYFTLPTEDVNGNPIDPEYLSYSIFVDNGNGAELFTFPAEDYTYDLTSDITEVPYWIYSDAIDFRNYFVYMYRTNEGDNPLFTENIGIQVYYTVNGVKNASDIVWLYDVDANVNEINAGKTVANVRYFNVAGQEMAQPNGMTIKVTTYTDGTTSTAKVVK
mgnify:CR=1 FL=1